MHEPSSTPGDILFVGRRFRVVRREQHCGDGEIRMREVIEHPGSVVIVPLTACGDVCLVEVVRTAVGATLLELPAGTLDRPEPPADAAVRELAEETGYRVGRITPLGGFWMSPGVLRERMHLFLAEDLTAGPQALEPGEEIRTREVPWREAVAMCLDGRIEDAKSVAGLLLVDRLFSGPRGPDAGGVGPAARFNPGEQAGPQRCAREESSPDGGR